MTDQGEIIVQVKRAAKEQYAWPGGYPLFVVLTDGALCTTCAKKELGLIAQSTASQSGDGWQALGVGINWADAGLYCDHCNRLIEAAYV